ncbi:MAG: phospho-N-acetylmuramoyl-pentapeptide-transferase [Candidatus Electryonea clarkiae]|nr:phospho-N-acetylmuramoyl-pentapeptide-transferase [Candidatus Electryonea clarkiae]MDP8289197.1 phospho-N-acetylmuramoyl-pentapeptide-transferase [Candidatus Electryonea clarkiae]
MIYLIAEMLESLGGKWEVFRVFQYVSVRAIAASITTLLLIILFSPSIIRKLHLSGQRDTQRDIDINLAKSKRGTPTMGGIIILFSVFISLLLWSNILSHFIWVIASCMIVFGLLGATDDISKVRGGHADAGLSRTSKLLVQGLFGIALGMFLYFPITSPFSAGIADTVGVPFIKPASMGGFDIHLGWGYIFFVAFVVMAISNAVNLIDGLDGLAAGTTLPPVMVYAVFAYILGNIKMSEYLLYNFMPGVHELVVFAAALIGALIGFLWYNGYPAEVFMGDTGSLALGGMLAAMVLLTKQELLFIIAGGLFFYVNVTHLIGDRIGINLLGRRIFYRTPIHHSYEHLGIAETKVSLRFAIVALVLAMLSLATLKIR